MTETEREALEQLRRRGVPSPDEWDAVALTFAEPVSIKRPVLMKFTSEFG